MLTLYTTPRADGGFPSLSPFCAKLEVWLDLAGIEYTRRNGDFRRSPNSKIPFVDLDGELIADSHRIIGRCKVKYGPTLDAGLTAEQHGVGRAVQRMLEEATYFGMVRARWLTDHGFAFVRSHILDRFVPRLVRPLAYPKIKRDLRRTLHGQGVLRYPLEEVYQAVIDDAEAIVAIMGERPFLLGDAPSSYDATVFGFLGCLAISGYSDPAVDHVRGSAALSAYRERMVARLGPAMASS